MGNIKNSISENYEFLLTTYSGANSLGDDIEINYSHMQITHIVKEPGVPL